MATLIPDEFPSVDPSEADALLAQESSRLLASSKLGRRNSVRIQLVDDADKGDPIAVPTSACGCSCTFSRRCLRGIPSL